MSLLKGVYDGLTSRLPVYDIGLKRTILVLDLYITFSIVHYPVPNSFRQVNGDRKVNRQVVRSPLRV